MTTPANPVLFFHPDGFRASRADLKGRHSAGESFLSAYLDQTAHPDVYALCGRQEEFHEFEAIVKDCERPLQAKHVGRNDIAVLRQQGLLHLPHPQVAEEARVRSFHGETAYAICGVTHTISSRAIIDAIADLATAPAMPWDAVILTSRAVEKAVSVILGNAEDYLRRRTGAAKFTRPMLPVIPLGTHVNRFQRKDSDRGRWRSKLQLADDTIAVLFFGRLSFHAKASPFQLAQAVEMAAAEGKQRYAIIWCGWFNDDFQQSVFMDTAKQMAPSVEFHHVDGRAAETRFSIWSAADIFCSLSDNIQETFGLTIIEAMAAGLPVIASNWDGYRDTIKNGITGILVDTYFPEVSLADVANRHISGVDSYDQFIGAASQFCAVDVTQTARWIARLGQDGDWRRKLAAAARQAAESEFDWKVILPRYQDLWRAQLEALERARRNNAPNSLFWKGFDPAAIFASYPSHRLDGRARLARGPHFAHWDDLVKEKGIAINQAVLMNRTEFYAIRDRFAADEVLQAGHLLAGLAAERQPIVLRSLYWLVKIGLLRIASSDGGDAAGPPKNT